MRRQLRRALVAAAATTLLTVVAVPAAGAATTAPAAGAQHAPARYPAVVDGHAPSLHPEGVTWDAAHQRFLVGSLRHGTVSVVRPDGSVRTLVDDPSALVSVIGLHADPARGRVLLANGDNGVGLRSSAATTGLLAGIGAYDLETGRRIFYTDLAAVAGDGGPHFANDIAFGPDGTAYVTDSRAPIVYRVGVDGRASVLLRDERLAAAPGGYGLNGIVYQDGALLLGKYDDGTLWRVALRHPSEVRPVPVGGAGGALVGLDGLAAGRGGAVLGITNALGAPGRDAQVELRSSDGWRTARLAAVHPSADPAPTAVTAGPGGHHYQLAGRMDLLFAGTTSDTFVLRRV
ncbi:gluconolaconase [Kitasatospora sp. NPDC057015]|uniref:gluconolaconase n=1 Tax=Kitasatospora sp. NPDC057015 TaxID=3346001 RepID=UPI00362F3841